MRELRPDVDLAAYAVAKGIRLPLKTKHWHLRAIAWLLRLLGNRRFLTHQWTTMGGRRVYHPELVGDVELDREVHGVGRLNLGERHRVLERHRATLLHEYQHAADARRWPVWFQVTYLLGPLPVLLSFGRVYWEAKGYAWTILQGKRDVDSVVDVLWRVYAWPLPRPWIRWFVRRAAKRLQDDLQ